MFIHAVTTPRKIEVKFNEGKSNRGNQVSLLTGPNGSGKTDVLATIADVFHGALQHPAGAQVHWSRGESHHVAESLFPWREIRRERVRVIAQTFSPFSRFPGRELRPPYPISPIYARGHSSDEQYVCIGFSQNSRVDLRQLSLMIVENGILRLSEQPKVARVAFDVLEELNFKNGIGLSYFWDERLTALINHTNNRDAVEHVLEQYARTGHFIVDGEHVRTKRQNTLLEELRKGSASEVADYVSTSIKILIPYAGELISDGAKKFEQFKFTAFRGREGMSSDFPVLQSLAFLRRLGFLTLKRCTLTSYQGGAVDLTQTSSGQQQMLCSIFGLASALEDDAIVLIDEPELSLHPRWQLNFFKHLETALEAATNCHVIVATHSPLIAQAGVAHGAEIIHMGDVTKGRSSYSLYERTESSIEELLVEVFDTPVPHSLHISNEIFSLVTKAESGTNGEQRAALEKLHGYLETYRRDGEGSSDMEALLKKAIRLISSANPTLG